MVNSISVLGCTGSIGRQTIAVAEHAGIPVAALSANRKIDLLEEQTRRLKPKLVAVYDEDAAKQFRTAVADLNVRVVSGMEGLIEAAAGPESECVVTAVSGSVGLKPTLAAIRAKKRIALANKETLVCAGSLVMRSAAEEGAEIIPVDSEHSAIFQCLMGRKKGELKKILLTGSGGPFRGKRREELENITPQQAVKHPNWNMGAKISVDSATMMNKGLEFIEAMWLFDLRPEQIEIVVHRESVIHSAVEYEDNSVIAQLGVPDMKIPIQYALLYPNRVHCDVKHLSLTDYGKLTFSKPDYETFKCLTACIKAVTAGGILPAAVNGANEQAVAAFLDGKISFLGIGELVEEVLGNTENKDIHSVDDILEADRAAREYVAKRIIERQF